MSNGGLWLGYYHLIPAGYSSYTYDPDICFNIYIDTSYDWFFRYALDSEMRAIAEVQRMIEEITAVDKILLGE